MTMGEADRNLWSLVADIVAAYVGGNQVPPSQLPEVIRSVHDALASPTGDVDALAAEPLKPAVSIRRSVTPEYIVCLEDGKKLKMLKRHLRTTYDMTPEQYRTKWGLPIDYPMVAPSYAARRSEFAKQIGLGRKAVAERPRKKGAKA